MPEASVLLNGERAILTLSTCVGIARLLPSGSNRLNQFVCTEPVRLVDHAGLTFKRAGVFWTGSGGYSGGCNSGPVEVGVLIIVSLVAHNDFIWARISKSRERCCRAGSRNQQSNNDFSGSTFHG